jgi:DNA-binding XRE family transcriptional regulator
MTRWAVISDCGTYRYELTRRWADGDLLDWIMLNPSIADGDQDDPTIRRCMGFARDWGFNGIRVTNLFAYRATQPMDMQDARDPIGPDNRHYLSVEAGSLTVCAWGSHPAVHERWKSSVHDAIQHRDALICLGYNQDGNPKHPLYVPKNAAARPWPKPDPDHRDHKGVGRPVRYNVQETSTALGARLRQLRVDANLTQLQVGTALGAGGGRVSEFELGYITPSLRTLTRYADVLDTTVSKILDGVL